MTRWILTLAVAACAACSHDWEALSAGDSGGGGGCGFEVTSNVDPCDLPPVHLERWVVGTEELVDTLSESLGTTITQLGGTSARVVHVGSLEIPVDAALLVTGVVPLIIVVDGDAVIEGQIHSRAFASGGLENDPEVCSAAGQAFVGGEGLGPADSNCSGGGGGGAFAGRGGTGNGCNSATGVTGGTDAADLSLTPIRPGCSGAPGGTINGGGVVEAAPGPAGGGLQLTVGGALTLGEQAYINASGGVGAGGTTYNKGSSESGGGGGGGSGGGILLEVGSLDVEAGALVCANGGGGGGGAQVGSGNGAPGATVGCSPTGEDGGDAGGAEAGAGGEGGSKSTRNGGTGGAGATGGGGGGGGSAGVIRVRSAATLPSLPTTWTPAPDVN